MSQPATFPAKPACAAAATVTTAVAAACTERGRGA